MIGGFGRAEVLSFHATKVVHAFEGGAVVTEEDDLADRVRLMRNFGFRGYDEVVGPGTNGKMTEVSAAMGLTSLESLPALVEVNRTNHLAYRAELDGIAGLHLYEHDETEDRNHQYVVVEVDAERAGIDRDLLVEALHAENVLARRYFHPGCHRMEPYASRGFRGGPLPVTERLTRRVMCLPTGTAVGAGEIRTIGAAIRLAVRCGPEITRRRGDSHA
jgi:dTDP-4-amino-4,6-dideoxygalactose transaminase